MRVCVRARVCVCVLYIWQKDKEGERSWESNRVKVWAMLSEATDSQFQVSQLMPLAQENEELQTHPQKSN